VLWPVAGGLVFEHQAILSNRPVGPVANLENKSRWPSLHQGRIQLTQMTEQSALYIVGLTDIDPFARI
jgi:hypothetical protein